MERLVVLLQLYALGVVNMNQNTIAKECPFEFAAILVTINSVTLYVCIIGESLTRLIYAKNSKCIRIIFLHVDR